MVFFQITKKPQREKFSLPSYFQGKKLEILIKGKILFHSKELEIDAKLSFTVIKKMS